VHVQIEDEQRPCRVFAVGDATDCPCVVWPLGQLVVAVDVVGLVERLAVATPLVEWSFVAVASRSDVL